VQVPVDKGILLPTSSCAPPATQTSFAPSAQPTTYRSAPAAASSAHRWRWASQAPIARFPPSCAIALSHYTAVIHLSCSLARPPRHALWLLASEHVVAISAPRPERHIRLDKAKRKWWLCWSCGAKVDALKLELGCRSSCVAEVRPGAVTLRAFTSPPCGITCE